MSVAKPKPVTNRLIAELPLKQRKQFLERCEPVELVFGDILCEPDQPFEYVYFPLTGFISLVALTDDHKPLEMGMIGNEGMLGGTLALGIASARLRGVVQGSGSALRMSAQQLQRELKASPELRAVLGRYVYVLMGQLTQTATCNCFHEVEARLARWLLMTDDRSHSDHFRLTHQFLADMLGVQRSAVTIAAGKLQNRKLIHYARGKISILSRSKLEAASCECYAATISNYAQQFANPAVGH
jgi:CRP-like cAMP-binding protein